MLDSWSWESRALPIVPGQSKCIKNVVIFIQSANKETICPKSQCLWLVDWIWAVTDYQSVRGKRSFGFQTFWENRMGVQIETMKEGDGVTFPQKGQKVSFTHLSSQEHCSDAYSRFPATMCWPWRMARRLTAPGTVAGHSSSLWVSINVYIQGFDILW